MAVPVSAEEELVIKKRLLTQTTVARVNADPPLKKLSKRCGPTARTRRSGVDSSSRARRFLALCAAADQGLSEESSGLHALFLRELELYEFQARAATALSPALCALTAGAARAAVAHRHGEQRQRARAGELRPAAGAAGGVHGAGMHAVLLGSHAGGRSRC